MDRAVARANFLGQAGWVGPCLPMAADASDRRFFRLSGPEGEAAVLMDAGARGADQTRAFIAVDDWLRVRGFSAPGIRHADPAQGLVLMEDLGDATFTSLLDRDPAMSRPLYAAATLFLRDLHRFVPDIASGFPRQDRAYFVTQSRLLTEHYLPGTPEAELRRLDRVLDGIFARLQQTCTVLTLRDFHAGNLIWLPGREGSARAGLVDFQDALVGHPAYDLASLLQDSRRAPVPGLEEEMLQIYWSGAVPDWFRHDYAAMAAQRHLRVLGIFARLADQGRPHYLRFIPQTLAWLRHNLDTGLLPGLADWVAANLGAAAAPKLQAGGR